MPLLGMMHVIPGPGAERILRSGIPQSAPQDLPRGGPRQRGPKFHDLGHPDSRQVATAVLKHIGRGDSLGYHDGLQSVFPIVEWHTYYCNFLDPGKTRNHRFHLDDIDRRSGDMDDLARPAGEEKVPVLIRPPQIPGTEPATLEGSRTALAFLY